MEPGLRVVRGPDWKWSNQDDGEGHVGTVVEIGKPGSTSSPDKTVVVQWDSGTRTNYRTGYQGAFDLALYDNAVVGVKHPNIICDICKRPGIKGMRWKCIDCHDYDLCTVCYMSDKHDLTHSFLRFVTQNSIGVKVSKRQSATRLSLRGLFPGAKVVRGPDWDWGNQDGGEGKVGKITDIRGWDVESGRSVASVSWSGSATNVYRVGHKGKVDLKYTQDAIGGYYYKEHLPKLGEDLQTVPMQDGKASLIFSVGDKVKVILEEDVLKAMQEGHGGWNPKMAECIGKVGVVHRVTERGDIRVQYPPNSIRWTFHPGSLNKVDAYASGDRVRVSTNISMVKKLQVGHGEWSDNMKDTLGKTGKVIKVYPDGDLRVSIGDHTWTFNPSCVSPVEPGAPDLNNTLVSERDEEQSGILHLALDQIISHPSNSDAPAKLVSEAAQGNKLAVAEILSKHSDWVDSKNSGKTALQVASHQGHLEVIKVLLLSKASLEIQDQDGDTALHYAVFGNQPDVVQYLLNKKAKIDAVNNGQCSSLHVAVNKSFTACVRVLLRHKCNINLQDSYGDTALHDAIAKNCKDIIDMLTEVDGADFTLKNQRGFNVIHHAALKGNQYATEKLVVKARQLVNLKKGDGFSALHLAALNGHRDVAEVLITRGQADIDIQNNRKQTPLLLTVGQGHTAVLELLVSKGAHVNAEDEDGDTSLHLALMRQSVYATADSTPILSKIRSSLPPSDNNIGTGPAVACYLTIEGANLQLRNHLGKTPLDLAAAAQLDSLLKQCAELRQRRLGELPKNPPNLKQKPASRSAPKSASAPLPGDLAASRAPDKPPVAQTDGGNLQAIMTQCRMCQNPANCQFRPCGHQATCMECAKLFQKCFICKEPVTEAFKLDENNKCTLCSSRSAEVTFIPCGHRTVCQECSHRLKECTVCKKTIVEKLGKDGRQVSTRRGSAPTISASPKGSSPSSVPRHKELATATHPSSKEVQELRMKMQELEDAQLCNICMERKRDTAFLCGHSTCKKCAKPLKQCPICRKPITKKIMLFT
ncbi:E3 ubiquitin-protein ligase MIB2-like isoform X2 [Acanthaster planci]|uniref:RING-type E3 ubiquitin transferase n=1 Tax=Acanthaster planci TaxID=133434 RepID=A0A8B7ZLE4_ACAPL|nr:E3 ubiquitin-protein ligase MIB2-like isoform X2 [Acanthaster planci]